MKQKLILIFVGFGWMIHQNTNACHSMAPTSKDYSYIREGDDPYYIVTYHPLFEQMGNIEKKIKLESIGSRGYINFSVAPVVGNKWMNFKFHAMNDIYFQNKQNIYWNGELVKNSDVFEALDIDTFRQQLEGGSNRYASDKNYIYYRGKRSDDNAGVKAINLEDLIQIEGDYMTDGHGVYHRGRYLGTNNKYKIIQQAIQSSIDPRCFPPAIYRFAIVQEKVFAEGYPLENVDAETFMIKEWGPRNYSQNIGDYLHYSDKNGEFIAEFDKVQDKYIIEEKNSK